MSEFVKPDVFFNLNIEGDEQKYPINAKFDRVDHIRPIGHWMLKIFTDDRGLVTMHVDEATGRRVAEMGELPIVERDTIFKSEYEGYLEACASHMDDSWLEGEGVNEKDTQI